MKYYSSTTLDMKNLSKDGDSVGLSRSKHSTTCIQTLINTLLQQDILSYSLTHDCFFLYGRDL